MATLNGAVALAKMHNIAVSVGQDLKFDVSWVLDVSLDIDGGIVERLFRLSPGNVVFLGKRHIIMRDPHPAASSSCNSFNDNRITNLAGDLGSLGLGVDRPLGPGDCGHPDLSDGLFCDSLVAHDTYRVGLRPDEADVTGFALLGELAVLGKEAVARVDGIDVCDLGRTDDAICPHVAVSTSGTTNTNGLIGELNMKGLDVGLRIYRQSLYT